MKNKINISKWVMIGLGIVFLSSCSQSIMDRININPDNPTTAASKFIITDLETSTAFNIVGADLSLYASVYIEHEVGTYNQMWDAELRISQPTASSTYDNAWVQLYTNFKNAKIAIANCSTGGPEAGNQITKGVAEIFAAYNLAVLTDMFGDVPYLQAADLNFPAAGSHFQPAIDKQQVVYQGIFAYLNQAISDLQGQDAGSTGPMGAQDLMFGGDKTRWLKFAYGLEARYTMHLLFRSTNQTQDLQNIIAWANKSFSSPNEDAKYAVYQGIGTSAASPFAQFFNDRDYFSVSQSFVTKLLNRNDPRSGALFMNYASPTKTYPNGYYLVDSGTPASIYAAPNGTTQQVMDNYDVSVYSAAAMVPTDLLSYHELQFLKAEAFARLGNQDSAWACMSNGVRSCIATKIPTLVNDVNQELIVGTYPVIGAKTIPDSVVVNYLNTNVKPLFLANPLREVMVQKYLAFYGGEGEALEAYNDYRRLQAFNQQSYITLANPLDAQGKFPLRYTYGVSDVSANPNVATVYGNGQYVYTAPVWWAGGSN